ncbi:MAG: class I SAM-dependent methyltransferase [Nitrospiraceae bacterium]
MPHAQIDAENAAFWNELCGSHMARELGISELSAENIRRFDEAYLRFYPYLENYVTGEALAGKRVLEIGLGYGTLGQLLASQGCLYYGLDIAPNPVAMMAFRLSLMGRDGSDRVTVGSALEIPHGDSAFDYVYSVGCLHHTGNLGRAISELYRVLVPGGKATIMLYNKYSFRQLVRVPLLRLRGLLRRKFKADFSRQVRAIYDSNAKGEAAPHTDYVSRVQARKLFREFRHVNIESQNFDNLLLLRGRLTIQRKWLLNNIARVVGLDLYIQALK